METLSIGGRRYSDPDIISLIRQSGGLIDPRWKVVNMARALIEETRTFSDLQTTSGATEDHRLLKGDQDQADGHAQGSPESETPLFTPPVQVGLYLTIRIVLNIELFSQLDTRLFTRSPQQQKWCSVQIHDQPWFKKVTNSNFSVIWRIGTSHADRRFPTSGQWQIWIGFGRKALFAFRYVIRSDGLSSRHCSSRPRCCWYVAISIYQGTKKEGTRRLVVNVFCSRRILDCSLYQQSEDIAANQFTCRHRARKARRNTRFVSTSHSIQIPSSTRRGKAAFAPVSKVCQSFRRDWPN